ncbi:hypothetical protein SKAU_G00322990 [Synaphobranchus kaupii]|uniref:Ig-like domain-containing protein n=1 Tax=Synaphobranchus kaupii TaxID=118154 RepID=A0A9Q1EP10_SYNKA|nr:hypothetical protein SKAU_G00322990 [Synaphobranchus kaupii]
MDSLMKMVAVALLVLWDVAQGDFGVLDRSYSVNVTVGQRVSLSCLKEKEHDYRISQMEWKKQEVGGESKIAIYNPRYGTEYFWKNVSLILESSGEELKGSVLHFGEVAVWNSGNYICELTTFPHGTVKAQTHLWVAERVSKPSVTYTCSKDSVTLTCNGEESDIKWSVNGRSMEGEFKKTVTVPGRPDHNVNYSCTAWNKVSEETSDELTIRCPVLLSIKVNQDVREGGEVSILCNSTPTADQYIFRTPRSKHPVLVNADGEFRLQEVTKDDGGLYTCQPRWTHGLCDDANVTVQLRVLPNEGSGGVTPRVASGTENRLLLLATHCWLLLYLLALTD